MSFNIRQYSSLIIATLFVILVFMNYFGYWTAARFVQIIFFFCMISAVYNAGIESGKKQKNRS